MSHWHQVRTAAEIWHFYAGAPIELRLLQEGGDIVGHTLGIDLAVGQRP